MKKIQGKQGLRRSSPQSPSDKMGSPLGIGKTEAAPCYVAGSSVVGVETGALGALAVHGDLATGTTGALASGEPIRAHIGPRTLEEVGDDLGAVGGCVVDTTTDRHGEPRLLVVHVPGRATHVIHLATIGDLNKLASALGGVQTAGFNAVLPSQAGLEAFEVWDAQVAAETLYAGLTPPAPSVEDIGARLGLDLATPTPVTPDFPKASDIRDAAKQAIIKARLIDRLGIEIRAAALEETVSLDMGVRRALSDMTVAGIRVDERSWSVLCEEQLDHEQRLRDELLTALKVVSLHDGAAVLASLRGHGLDLRSAKTDELLRYADTPLVQQLVDWRTTSAFVNDSGKNVWAALQASSDGRVHPAWNVQGTRTGRITSVQPNLLGLPKRARVHFIPERGSVFVHADIAAAQLRILAEVTCDAAMTNVFLRGDDPHQATARSLSRPGVVVDRDRAKPVNFGIPFGMKERGLIAYAWSSFGVAFSLEDAKLYLDRYRATYPQVAAWQLRVAKALPREVRGIGGRVRRYLPGDTRVRSRLASQIQATEADAVKRALIALTDELPPFGGRVVLVAYDAVLVECEEHQAEAVKVLVERCLAEGLERYLKRVPVVVKADIRRTWGP